MRPILPRCLALALAFAALAGPGRAQNSKPIEIVAAENVYGELAAAIGGKSVKVSSILFSPDQDPHSFEASAATAKLLSTAAIVVFNGAYYDAWMPKLLSAARSEKRISIEIAKLVGAKPGDNPHLWYDVGAMRAAAIALAKALVAADPADRAGYDRGLTIVLTGIDGLAARLARMRALYAGIEVTATEPVFGIMAASLGLKMRNERFQLAVMNATEPSARDLAAFEDDIRTGKAKLLLYNRQTSDALSQRLLDLAQRSNLPIVGVSETQPPGKTYLEWMGRQLDEVDAALRAKKP